MTKNGEILYLDLIGRVVIQKGCSISKYQRIENKISHNNRYHNKYIKYKQKYYKLKQQKN